MKKIILILVVALLPVFGFGQTDLVRWGNANLTSSFLAANVSASSLTNSSSSSGISESPNWCGYNFRINENAAGTYNTGRYVQFSITPAANYKIDLSQITFRYYRDGNYANNVRIRYSKQSNFSSGVQELNQTNLASGEQNVALSFPANTVVNAGETMYFRFHIYGNQSDNWWTQLCIRNLSSSDSHQGLTIRGTVASAAPPVPVAVNDNANTLQNQAVTVNVLQNDTTNGLPTTITTSQVVNGTVAPSGNQIVFTPTEGFTGTGSFRYTLNNANGTSNLATVTVNVTAPVAPTAVADSFPVAFNTFTNLNVLANDNLGSATTVTAINTTNPSHGTISLNANNTIRYTPTTGYAGSDSFTYRIQTTYGTSSYVTVSIMVQPTAPTGALCGDIYVGTNGHFATITQAINHVNTHGITCNVTMFLTNANYNNANGEVFPITINAYNGSNTYSLTIKPNSGVNATVRASNVVSTTPVRSVFKLNGARRVIFEGSNNNTASKNFTIINNCNIVDGSTRTVFALTGNHSRITFNNLQITQAYENGAYALASGIFSGGDTVGNVGTVASDNLTVSNNDFSGVKQGIYVDNNSSTTLTTVKVFGNRFGQNVGSIKAQNAIYLNGVTDFTIYKNQVKDVNSNFSATDYRGIYVNGSNGTIYKNTIYNIKRTGNDQSISGIWLKSNVGTNPVNVMVYNNFVTDIQTPGAYNSYSQGAYGLYIESGNGYKIYHNSVNLKQQTQTQGISAAIFIANGTNLDVRNNILNNNLEYNSPGRASIAMMNYSSNMFAHLDYNNYYSKGVIGIKGGNINWVDLANSNVYIQTLPQWRTSMARDANTTNVQPVFVDENSDLHLVPGNIVNVQYLGGITGLGIVDDIDGEERYIPRPTMGADEIDETHCGGSITWNGTNWSTYVLNGVTYPAPANDWQGNETLRVIIAGPYTLGNATLLRSCQLEIIADPAAKLTIKENATYVVEDKLTLNNGSIMLVEDKGSFVQVSEPDKNDIHPNATFQVNRKTQPMYRYDFTYWSSPVQDFKLKDVSITTLFDKFYSWNPTPGSWVIHPSTATTPTIMSVAKGYIVRAPQSYSTNPSAPRVQHEAKFIGKPNNGVREIEVENGTANKWNLIGNPYPSAIDAQAFITANQNAVQGAIYLWTHSSPAVQTANGSQIYTYQSSDYATLNASGATRSSNGGELPNGKIASGQSFFIKGKVSNPTATKVVFNNAMRVKAANQNNQFFKPGPTTPVDNWETTGKHRVWLNLTSAQNDFNQALVGYIENASNELDWAYDADVFSGGAVSLYSIVDQNNLTIQGRALPFNNQDQVPLGYKTTLTGTLKISIDEVDGLFVGQDVYLEDKTTNIVHNLKDGEYSFTTVPGTFNERFVLRYVPQAELGIENPVVDANSMVVFRNGNQIDIKSNEQTIEQVTVYDLLGKVIFDKNKINATAFSTAQLNVSNQVVIVKVITDTKAEVTKKIIMN